MHSPDSLHRLVKQAIDEGSATTLEEAHARFAGYRLAITVTEAAALDRGGQATLLTAVALARRVFLGGITVVLDAQSAVPSHVPLPLGSELQDAIRALGGVIASTVPAGCPVITVGDTYHRMADFHVRAVSVGWAGGVVPVESVVGHQDGVPVACTLAAALAISEAYFHVRGEMPVAGHRHVGFSLWRPDASDWVEAERGPALEFLPSKLWLIGLGHLGQAYLWALGLLPYPSSGGLELVLQDFDHVTPSTESTSILTDETMVGEMKTRAMAAWAHRRGFSTRIHERLFDASFQRQSTEPGVALCGLDNAVGRRALESVGFELVVEAGLGRGHRDFRTMRLHTLPGARQAADLWKESTRSEDVTDRAAYQHLAQTGVLDKCGVTLLAGKAVGAPFVGAVAASLAISEILRLLHGGTLSRLIDLDLACAEQRVVLPNGRDFSNFNPGFVRIDPT